ncbi:MAG: hypothetical protein QY306_09650 [Anaerolineales bacterium]|nr:MAG: hypothetical protein QY306_09650 [Anaerolineales bacterium]
MAANGMPLSADAPANQNAFAWKRAKLGVVLVFGILWLLFFLTTPYRIHLLALSPLGILIVLCTLAWILLVILRRVRQMHIQHSGLAIAAVLVFLLTSAQAGAPTPTGWNLFSNSISMLGSVPAWQAAIDIHPERGLVGMTPMFYQTVVPQFPITFIITPDPTLNHLEVTGILSGQHLHVLQDSPPVLDLIPMHSLPVDHIVFALPPEAVVGPPLTGLIPALSFICEVTCYSEIQFQANPEYLTLVTFNKVATTYIKMAELDVLSNYAATQMLNNATKILFNPEWNTAVRLESYGTTMFGGLEYSWYSNQLAVYSGSIQEGKWEIYEERQVVITQSWDATLPDMPVPDPYTFNQPTFAMPAFDPSKYRQPVYTQPNYTNFDFHQPTFNQPNYTPPDLNQPIYNPPDYNPPDFNQPIYIPPDINPPPFP